MRKVFLLFTAVLLSAGELFSYYPSSDSGGFPGEILLTLGCSARAMATGGAFSMVDGAAPAPYWNPAGLAGMDDYELYILHSPLLMDGYYSAFSYAHPLPGAFALTKNTTLGVGYYRIQSGDAQRTDVLGNTYGTFSDMWNVFTLTMARKISRSVNMGLNYKLVDRKYYGYESRLSGVEGGIQVKNKITADDILKLGFSVQNMFFGKLNQRSSEEVAPNVKIGFGYITWEEKVRLMLDIDQALDSKPPGPRISFGGEGDIFGLLTLRAGVNYKQVALGLGIHLFNMEMDYAYIFHDFGNMHRMGLNFRFGRKHDRDVAIIQKEKEKAKLTRKSLEKTNAAYKALITKAMEIFTEGDYSKAKEEFIKVARMRSLDEKTRTSVEEIIDNIDNIIAEKKEAAAEEHYKKAYQHFRDNSFDAAAEEIEEALRLKPEFKKAEVLKLRNLGFKFFVSGDLKEGEKYLEKALELDPENNGIKQNLIKLREYIKMRSEK
ncbi:MAG: hypothetical protein ACQESB_07320 [Elusimicrobiota bacterium]